jgi:hypothetical protein
MKLVKEHINEKFLEKSDPIENLGIGEINKIFNKTQDAYSKSANFYNNKQWKRIITWLFNKGYNSLEIEEILRSKLMRWANDNSGKSKSTLEDFIKYNEKRTHSNKTQIEDFLDDEVR